VCPEEKKLCEDRGGESLKLACKAHQENFLGRREIHGREGPIGIEEVDRLLVRSPGALGTRVWKKGKDVVNKGGRINCEGI